MKSRNIFFNNVLEIDVNYESNFAEGVEEYEN